MDKGQLYNCGAYGGVSFGECEELVAATDQHSAPQKETLGAQQTEQPASAQTTTEAIFNKSPLAVVATTGWDIIMPLAIVVAVTIAGLILIFKRKLRADDD